MLKTVLATTILALVSSVSAQFASGPITAISFLKQGTIAGRVIFQESELKNFVPNNFVMASGIFVGMLPNTSRDLRLHFRPCNNLGDEENNGGIKLGNVVTNEKGIAIVEEESTFAFVDRGLGTTINGASIAVHGLGGTAVIACGFIQGLPST